MATFSPNKGFIIPTVGADVAQWGIELNSTINVLDNNLGSDNAINAAGSANITLTGLQAQDLVQTLTGVLTGNIQLIVPNLGGFFIVSNQTTGPFTVTVISSAPAGSVAVPQGANISLYVDSAGNVAPMTTGYVLPSAGSFVTLAVSGATTLSGTLAAAGAITAAQGVVLPNNVTIRGLDASSVPHAIVGVSTGTPTVLIDSGAVGAATGGALLVNGQLTGVAACTLGGTSLTPINSPANGWAVGANGVAEGWSGNALGTLLVGNSGTTLVGFFTNGAGGIGSITTNGTTTAYNTTSDARLKIKERSLDGDDSGGVIDRLRALWFRWKATPDADPEPGFFAQQVYRVFPWAVTKGTGRPGRKGFQPWQMDAAKLMPVVIAELQSLRARMAELEKRR